jgi:hypothetical protein
MLRYRMPYAWIEASWVGVSCERVRGSLEGEDEDEAEGKIGMP